MSNILVYGLMALSISACNDRLNALSKIESAQIMELRTLKFEGDKKIFSDAFFYNYGNKENVEVYEIIADDLKRKCYISPGWKGVGGVINPLSRSICEEGYITMTSEFEEKVNNTYKKIKDL